MRNRANRRMVLNISSDGSLLLPTQTYAKAVIDGTKFDSDKFFWDPKSKCLRNFKHRQGCIGSAQQGCSTQMIAMGSQGDTGNTCASSKWDGVFLSVNGKFAQPQSGYTSEDNFVSLNDMSGDLTQQWTIKYGAQMGNRGGPNRRTEPTNPNWGWRNGNQFYMIASNGQKLYAQPNGNRNQPGYIRFHNGNPRTRAGLFQFDKRTKTIRSVAYPESSLAVIQTSPGKFRLGIQRTQRSTAELFVKLSQRGVV